jgi:hypothetical protein
MSQLGGRMIEDISIRKFAPAPQYTYVRFVNEFSYRMAARRRESRTAI